MVKPKVDLKGQKRKQKNWRKILQLILLRSW